MRILLTGGLGFIGGHTVEHWLKNTDWHIVVLDGLRHAGDVSRLTGPAAFDPSRVTLLWHDLKAPVYGGLAEDIGPVDAIVSMAADSHVDRSINDPVPFVRNNVDIALNTLEFARLVKPKKFIQIGTDEIFGPAPAGVSHKEDDVLRPSNPYSASKAAQELIAFAYWRTYGVPVICTRTMNNFGERQDIEKFVPMVIRRIIDNDLVSIHAQPLVERADPYDPTHWRSGSRVWLHARNHADALMFILNNVNAETYGDDQTDPVRFNIAGEREISNWDLANTIARILDKPLRYQFVDFHSARPGHDLRYSLDGSALRAAGWQQPATFDESFTKMVLWSLKHRR